MNQYYVYFLLDPRTCQPFYVGKGCDRRMYSHETEVRSGNWNNKTKCKTIQEIWSEGLEIEYVKVLENLDKHQANKKEKEFILYYGRKQRGGILTNVHIGGNGGGKVGIPVCQYSKEGILIAEFSSASEASRKTNICLSEITAVCRGDWKMAGGFQWRWNDESPIKNYERKHSHLHKAVKQYNMEGKFVTEYPSQYDAVRALDLPVSSATKISACCRYKLPSYKGFQWRYVDDKPPDKIHPQKKKILQYTLSGDFIVEHPSIVEAARRTKINEALISSCCRGTYKQGGGFMWRYKPT